MSSDYDKQQWQAEQNARDSALEKQREKERKTRERSARNAQRKLERLHRTLSEKGEITDFENEFGESVLERLDKFGAAFHDREKGRPGDALSFAQKAVVAAMNKKVKSLKKNQTPDDNDADFDDGYERTADRWKNQNTADEKSGKQKRSSFGSKNKPKFTPRVRHIDDDFENEGDNAPPATAPYASLTPELKTCVPYLPQYKSNNIAPKTHKPKATKASPPSPRMANVTPINIKAETEAEKAVSQKAEATNNTPKKPFLRLVK